MVGPELARLDAKRLAIVRRAIVFSLGTVAALVLFVVAGALVLGVPALSDVSILAIVVAVMLAFVLNMPAWLEVMSLQARCKSVVMTAAAAQFGVRYDPLAPDPLNHPAGRNTLKAWHEVSQRMKLTSVRGLRVALKGPSEPPTPAYARLKAASLLPVHDTPYFEDLITGTHAGSDFSLVECHLIRTGKNNSEHSAFRGVLFHMAFPARLHGRTLIARSGFSTLLKRLGRLEPVDLGSAELDAAFRILTTDQVEARTVLTPDRMERLIALEHAIPSARLRGVVETGHITLALESGDLFEGHSVFAPLVDPAGYMTALKELAGAFAVIEAFLGRAEAQRPLGVAA